MSTSRRSRAAWTAVDQGLSSASNFGIAFAAARLLDAEGFGAFGVAFAVYLIALGVARSVSTDPLMLRFAAAPSRTAERAALGTAVVVGLTGSAAIGLAAAFVGPSLRGALAALAVVLPGLLLQDAVRFAAFTRGRPQWASLSDGVWVAAEAVGMAALWASGRGGHASLVVLVWGVAAGVAVVPVLAAWRSAPAPQRARSWVAAHGVLARRFTAEFAITEGAAQLAVFFVAAFAGVADAGAFRAGQVLLGPLNVVLMATIEFAVPEGVRLRHDHSGLRRAAVGLATLLVGAAVAVGLAWMAVPAAVGEALLGAAWPLGRSVVVPLALAMAGRGAASVACAGLRVLEATDRSVRVRAAVAPMIVAGGAVGAAMTGARGAATLMTVAQAAGAAVAWRAFLRVWRAGAAPSTERTVGGAVGEPVPPHTPTATPASAR